MLNAFLVLASLNRLLLLNILLSVNVPVNDQRVIIKYCDPYYAPYTFSLFIHTGLFVWNNETKHLISFI